MIKWLQEHGETIDAILTEELGLQLFEYISDYYCEVKVHLKKKTLDRVVTPCFILMKGGKSMKETPIIKLLLRLSPPVMLALLIQSVYNIVDSYFVARYSAAGLTALSIIFRFNFLMTALAAGTGTGMNILISRMDGTGDTKSQSMLIKNGLFFRIV